MKRSFFIQAAAAVLIFAVGAACGYGIGVKRESRSEPALQSAAQEEQGLEVEEQKPPEPAVPTIRGVFSWHEYKAEYEDILQAYGIDQLYQCYDEELADGNIDGIRENLELIGDHEVWLLTGDPSWGAREMLEKVRLAEEIGGFRGVVFDVEPDEYDEDYARAVEQTCAESSMELMFCLPYWVGEDVVARVFAAADGVLAMNYAKGREYENIASWIALAAREEVPLVTIYELQPPNEKYELTEEETYDGDAAACEENFAGEFAGAGPLGMAYHYIKYL